MLSFSLIFALQFSFISGRKIDKTKKKKKSMKFYFMNIFFSGVIECNKIFMVGAKIRVSRETGNTDIYIYIYIYIYVYISGLRPKKAWQPSDKPTDLWC